MIRCRLSTLFMPVLIAASASGGIPADPMPDAYGGIAVSHGKDQEGDWTRMSLDHFRIGPDWEEFRIEIEHGGTMGASLSGYTYSSRDESFRYDAINGIKSVNLFDEGVLDRNPLLSPRAGYEMLAATDDGPIETLEDGTEIYRRTDPMHKRPTYIGVEPTSGRIVWVETRYDNGASRERMEYRNWTPIGDSGPIPTEVELITASGPHMGLLFRIEDVEVLDSALPPEPGTIGDHAMVYDYDTMKAYNSDGEIVGDVYTSLPDQDASGAGWRRLLVIGVGLGLIVCSGIVIARRRFGA